MHDVREHEHSVQPFLPARSRPIPRHVFHLLAAWFRRTGIYQAEQPRFSRRDDREDVIRAEQLDPHKGEDQVDGRYRGVNPDGVPPVRFHERL